MSNKNKVFIFAIFSILLHLSFTEDPVLRISQQLRKWATHERMEKVHIHFDKPYYAIGDTMWFKAYVVLAETNQLSAVSGILNIEVTSPENNLSRLIKLPINAGTAWGDFTLSDSLPAGTYRVRAFTNWMRNAGEEHFFSKIIEVGDIDKVSSGNKKSPKKLSLIADVQFFPEGGELVDGLSSIVAFKAINESGAGIPITGIIEDTDKNEISSFASRHAGMGSFKFKPLKGKKYQARIKFEDGSETSVPLPLSKEKGFVMAIDQQEEDKISLKITASELILKENLNTEISIVAHNGSVIYYAGKGKINASVFNSVISLKNFPAGVARFTLFDEAGRPLNERLVFIRKNNDIELDANSEKGSYTAGDKVKLSIQALAAGTYSVSVVDEHKVPFDQNNESSIFSNLLLTSDLKGNIEKPNYYFENKGAEVAANLDLLMLTHGYRRFNWQQILQENPNPIKYQAENSISISGRVITFSDKPVSKAKVTIIGPTSNLFVQTQADSSGRFKFTDMVFLDSINTLIQAETQRGSKDVKIVLDDFVAAPKKAHAISLPPDSESGSLMTAYLERNIDYYKGLKTTLLLPEVVVKASKYVQTYTSNLGGKDNYDRIVTYKEIDMMGGQLSTRLQGKFGSLQLINGWPYSVKYGLTPLGVIVDGIRIIKDNMTLDDINPDDVLTVELLEYAGTLGIYGVTGGSGLLIVNTKRGNEEIPNPNQYIAGTIKANITGFQKAMEFYTPKYSPDFSGKDKLPNTVFWKPNLITDKSGKAMVEFDAIQAGTYRVVIEGVDVNGKLGRKVFLYEVK